MQISTDLMAGAAGSCSTISIEIAGASVVIHDAWRIGRDRAPTLGQATHKPVGFDRVIEPGLGPALPDTATHGLFADFLTDPVEQRQFPARLFETTLQPAELRLTYPMNC